MSTLTPLSLLKSDPNIGLHHFVSRACTHLFPHSLARSLDISLSQAHTLCRVYLSHTHKTSPPNDYLPSHVVLAHSPHTPPPLQTSTLCLLVHHSRLSISPTCGPAPDPPCIHICRDSFHSSLMYNRSRFRTLFSTPSILDLS